MTSRMSTWIAARKWHPWVWSLSGIILTMTASIDMIPPSEMLWPLRNWPLRWTCLSLRQQSKLFKCSSGPLVCFVMLHCVKYTGFLWNQQRCILTAKSVQTHTGTRTQIYVYIYIYTHTHLSAYLYLSRYLSIYLSVCLSIYLSCLFPLQFVQRKLHETHLKMEMALVLHHVTAGTWADSKAHVAHDAGLVWESLGGLVWAWF